MGLFKSLKDMKDMVHEAPEMIATANDLSANAQANAAAQQAAAQQAVAAANAAGGTTGRRRCRRVTSPPSPA